MTPPKEDARRRQSWTKRTDDKGKPGKIGYFTGTEWAELEAGARATNHTTRKTVKGQPRDVPDVKGYVMKLHKEAMKGASSE